MKQKENVGGTYSPARRNEIHVWRDMWENRNIIRKLARNDFKRRYVGSYMGILWAFIQPLVTIALYYAVFGLIMTAARSSGSDVPFVLYLTAGMVPWFFFSEGWNSGTNALLEYSYLVKKVVFRISILPVIKVVAAIYTHLFFVLLLLIVGWICGYPPSLYTLQVLYYSVCCFVLVLALSYFSGAVVVFFRDLRQLISILLQVLVWGTPIMWNLNMVHNVWIRRILMLNPVYYIVDGYRDSVFQKQWIWEKPLYTLYFWCITFLLMALGTGVFKKLRGHFADVL